jgi:hypothetical protein
MVGHEGTPPAVVASDPKADLAGSLELAEPVRVVAAPVHVRRRKLLRLLTISLVLGSVGLFDGGIVTRLAAAFFGVCARILHPYVAGTRLSSFGASWFLGL